jgi:hypothetical protein
MRHYILTVGCSLVLAAGASAQPVEGRFERTLPVSGRVDLDVRAGSGSITIRPGSGTAVQVRGRIVGRSQWRRGDADIAARVRHYEQNPPVEQQGSWLRVGHLFEEESWREGLSFSYDITVPVETTVTARAGSGSVVVQGLRGRVEARVGSGSLRLTDITGDVSASAGSGAIEVAGGRGDTDVRTGSGSVRVTDARGPLTVRTGSGRITADGQPQRAWRLLASSGSITVRVPQEAAFELDASTNSGHIDSRHPVTVVGTFGRRRLTGTVRGGGFRLEARTSSGDIRIE